MPREAADVDLVDDRLLDRNVRVLVPFPVEVASVGHAPQPHPARCRPSLGRRWRSAIVGIGVVVARAHRPLPVEIARDRPGVRIDQRLCGR